MRLYMNYTELHSTIISKRLVTDSEHAVALLQPPYTFSLPSLPSAQSLTCQAGIQALLGAGRRVPSIEHAVLQHNKQQ